MKVPLTHLILMTMRLDTYTTLPSGMEEYLSTYGWHFSKKMAEWALDCMSREDDKDTDDKKWGYTRESLDRLLRSRGIKLKKNKGYDDVYVANMCMADLMGSSIKDEASLALYVKDVIDDFDGYDGIVFTRFYADCIGKGLPIMWEDML